MLDKIIGLIPEFYFDLIARISPGTLICIALAFPIIQLETFVLKIKEIPVPLIFLFFVASYITGFLLDAVTATIEELFDRICYNCSLKKIVKRLNIAPYMKILEELPNMQIQVL